MAWGEREPEYPVVNLVADAAPRTIRAGRVSACKLDPQVSSLSRKRLQEHMLMDRRLTSRVSLLMIATLVFGGCTPQQPFFLNEDGDLSHLLTEATELSYPDVDSPGLPDAIESHEPMSLLNQAKAEPWDLTLEEAISTALANSKVIRTVGQVRQFRQVGQGVAAPPESLAINSDFASTIYDPAIEETGQNGVETALAQFDTQWNTDMFWEKNDRTRNNDTAADTFFARQTRQDRMNLRSELTKRGANGTQWTFRNTTDYDANNSPLRGVFSEWVAAFETEMRHPLLRNSGTQVNRTPVVLARIRTDIALVDFEANVRNLLSEVEKSYWELYYFYYNLNAAITGRDSALLTWQRIQALFVQGAERGDAPSRAQSQEQYYFFRGRVEEAYRDLLKAERQLRFLMGLSPTDGRLIRPIDEPSLARVQFDWQDAKFECLNRSSEIRRQKWRVKEQELGLIVAKNSLLPQLDAVALYRWVGIGDELWRADRGTVNFPEAGSQAFDELTEGNFQEWRLGLEMNMPLGFRAEMSQVRNRQLALARERAKLNELELELSHSLTDAIQNLDANYQIMQTALLQGLSARQQVDALQALLEHGTITLDLILDAQRRLAESEVAFYQSLIQYNMSIVEVHYRKGSLMEYCGVMLAEGPWPTKAYWDAEIRARRRDASYFLNYGYTRPAVISRGGVSGDALEAAVDGNAVAPAELKGSPSPTDLEILPSTEPEPISAEIQATSANVATAESESGVPAGESAEPYKWELPTLEE
jgi:outer membrane protein TolC